MIRRRAKVFVAMRRVVKRAGETPPESADKFVTAFLYAASQMRELDTFIRQACPDPITSPTAVEWLSSVARGIESPAQLQVLAGLLEQAMRGDTAVGELLRRALADEPDFHRAVREWLLLTALILFPEAGRIFASNYLETPAGQRDVFAVLHESKNDGFPSKREVIEAFARGSRSPLPEAADGEPKADIAPFTPNQVLSPASDESASSHSVVPAGSVSEGNGDEPKATESPQPKHVNLTVSVLPGEGAASDGKSTAAVSAIECRPKVKRPRVKYAEQKACVKQHVDNLTRPERNSATRESIVKATGVSAGNVSRILKELNIKTVGMREKASKPRTVPLQPSMLAVLPAKGDTEGDGDIALVKEAIDDIGFENFVEVAKAHKASKAENAEQERRHNIRSERRHASS
jgi:hypothetical protein